MGRIAAIARVAGTQRPIAQIFAAGTTIRTDATGRAEPGHADPLADRKPRHASPQRSDPSHDLMAGNERKLRIGKLAVHHMQVGTTYAAGRDLEQYVTGRGRRSR
jgi:hypothetical protein